MADSSCGTSASALGYRCPECLGGFLSPTECRGTMDKGFHPTPIPVLPVIGCEPPPLRTFRLVLGGFGARAVNDVKAGELLTNALRYRVGGDTKKAGEIMDRLRIYLDVEEVA